MASSCQLAMTAEIPPTRYTGYSVFKTKISEQADILKREYKDPYLAFNQVSKGQWEYILRRRRDLVRGKRLVYFPDISTLIVKIPSEIHESAAQSLAHMITRKIDGNGRHWTEFYPLGASRFQGKSGSEKQGDVEFKNKLVRPKLEDWPHLVIEAAVSESFARLRAGAKWWIEASEGTVNVIIIVHINVAAKHIDIEIYTPRLLRALRSGSRFISHKMGGVLIDCSVTPPVIQNAPLILGFPRVFGRAPQSPQEQDVILDQQALTKWATNVFSGL